MSFRFPTETVNEGKIRILVPKLSAYVKEPSEYAPSKAPVFYNPAMELNRDLAVVALQVHQKRMKRELFVCEPLTGCGVRGIRLAVEVEGIPRVLVNDISPEATRLAAFNVQLNDLADRVIVRNEDANLLLSRFASPRKRFDYIDIDPFGSPVPYLDSAVRALRNGGLLALTATDMAPLCGVHPKACLRKYGGKPLRTEYCHELALRLLISSLALEAGKHDIGISPVFSYSEYNYVRTYVTVGYSAKQADDSIGKRGYILHCFNCFHRESQERILPVLRRDCPECGSELQVAGPLWLGPLLDLDFCHQMKDEAGRMALRNKTKIRRIVSLLIQEAEGPITYYVLDKICDKLNLPVPSLSKIIRELDTSGYKAVPSHFGAKAFRTDAPSLVIRNVISRLSKLNAREIDIREHADD